MSDEQLLEPINYYKILAPKVRNVSEEYHLKLTELSGIDIEQNRKSCKELEHQNSLLENANRRVKFLIALIVISVLTLLISVGGVMYKGTENDIGNIFMLFVALVPLSIFAIVMGAIKKKKLSNNIRDLESTIRETKDTCNKQMQPLNSLFDYSQFLQIAQDVLPSLKFNQFTNAAFAQIIKDSSADTGIFNTIRANDYSIDSSLSGTIDGKIFAFLGYKKFYWGTRKYEGTLPITYIDYVSDSEGRRHAVVRTQILVAYVEKPYPKYKNDHCGVYFSDALPRLNFTRRSVGLFRMNDKEIESFIKKRTKKLLKKEKKALKSGVSWTALADNEFETLFNAENRDNDVEFRMMFTPYCIKNYNLLFKSKLGLGDSFTLIKEGKVNFCDLDASLNETARPQSAEVKSHSYDISKMLFIERSCSFFRELFFTLAPFSMVPVYSHSSDYKEDDWREDIAKYDTFDAESISAGFDDFVFRPKAAVTEIIRKIVRRKVLDFGNLMTVQALGYYIEKRIDYVPVFGRDGYMHNVPVPWDEYLLCTRERDMFIAHIGIKEAEFYSKLALLNCKDFKIIYKDGFIALISNSDQIGDNMLAKVKEIVTSFNVQEFENTDPFSLRKIRKLISVLDKTV